MEKALDVLKLKAIKNKYRVNEKSITKFVRYFKKNENEILKLMKIKVQEFKELK